MGAVSVLKKEKTIPIVMADQNGLITYVNSPFEKTYGWKLSDIKGKHLTSLMPPRFHNAHNLGFSRFLSTQQPTLLNKPLNLHIVKKNGEELKSVHTIFAEQIDDQWIFGATILPLDEVNNATNK